MTRHPTVGQVGLDGTIHGLDKLVSKPEVIENDGLRVIHFAISSEDHSINGFTDEALKKARMLVPEVKSKGRPVWMTAAWQAKRRKMKSK